MSWIRFGRGKAGVAPEAEIGATAVSWLAGSLATIGDRKDWVIGMPQLASSGILLTICCWPKGPWLLANCCAVPVPC